MNAMLWILGICAACGASLAFAIAAWSFGYTDGHQNAAIEVRNKARELHENGRTEEAEWLRKAAAELEEAGP